MKRSAALAPLSRDHQHALDAAMRLRRADASSVAAAVEHFLTFFESEGSRHFDIAEQVLAPALLIGDPEWEAGVARMRADHAVIREAAGELPRTSEPVASARSLGQVLHDHVRFEERVLFEILETRLAPDELERLAAAMEDAERRPNGPLP